MKYVLSDPVVTGPYTVVIVSRQAVDGRLYKGACVAALCTKQPVYVVVREGQARTVLDMSGAKVPLEEVQTLCPGITRA